MLHKGIYTLIDNTKKIRNVNYLMELQDSKSLVQAKDFLEELKKHVNGEEGEVLECKKSISNIMIYLLTKSQDPKNLEAFLKEKNQSKDVDFDLNFAMHLCQQNVRLQRCEIIMCG